VLSLFFIDVVEHYRSYTTDGVKVKGKYALMFEEEYRRAVAKPKYRTLFNDVDLDSDAAEVHDGYFSIRQKGNVDGYRRGTTRVIVKMPSALQPDHEGQGETAGF